MKFFADVEKAIEREFRRWTERVFGPAEAGDLLLVHRAILEDVESHVQIGPRGRPLFPFNRVVVKLASPDAARRTLLESAFRDDARLEREIRESLGAAGCEIAPGFAVEIETAAEGPPFAVDYLVRKAAPREARARLVVTRGAANAAEFALDRPRINLGRLREIADSNQRVIRRNDVVFEEGGETGGTVSRAHAHIRFDAQTGEYRIVDDGSEYGTRIFREGRSIDVPKGGQKGERLRAGDEIYLGRACMEFHE